MILSILDFFHLQFFSGLKILEFINFDIFHRMVVVSLLCMVGDGPMWGGRWEGVALGRDVGRVLGGSGHTHILDSCTDKRVSVCHV